MKTITKIFLGIIILIVLCGFTACDLDKLRSVIPGQLTVQNEPSGGGKVFIIRVPSLGSGIFNIPDLSQMEIVAMSTGTSPYTLIATDIGTANSTGIFIESGSFWVAFTESVLDLSDSALFATINLSNGSGTVNYTNMKVWNQFLIGLFPFL